MAAKARETQSRETRLSLAARDARSSAISTSRKALVKSSQNVLLVNPRITSRRNARFPLSILNLAAAIEPDFKSVIVDGNVDPDAVGAALRAIRNEAMAAVGVTVMGGPQVATAIAVSRAIRSAAPDLPIVWGGYFPTLYPEVALNCDYVDFVVRGQGEETFSESAWRDCLLRVLGSPSFSDHIPALSWRQGWRGRAQARIEVRCHGNHSSRPDAAV